MESDAIGHFNAELIASVAALQERVTRLESERAELAQALESQKQNSTYYKERFELMQRQLYGKKSEKRRLDAVEGQSLLPGFDDDGRPVPPAAEKLEKITYTRRKGRSRGTPIERSSRFPEHLPREVVDLPPEETGCSSCQGEMTHVIRVEVTEKLCCNGNPFFVREYRRPVLCCRTCEEVAPMAVVPEVFERTSVDHSVVAYLLSQKFRFSLPLFRQGQMIRDLGLVFSNDALIDWTMKGLDLLQPVYRALLRAGDGLPVPACRRHEAQSGGRRDREEASRL